MDVASNPEFLREGSAIHDFMFPDRVVIGTSSERASALLTKLYEPLNAPLLLTDHRECRADQALRQRVPGPQDLLHQRRGPHLRQDGCRRDPRGQGQLAWTAASAWSSCRRASDLAAPAFPRDVEAFIGISASLGYDFQLLREVLAINQEQRAPGRLQAGRGTGGSLAGRKVGLLGLTFKPNTDDLREAPSLEIVRRLHLAGALVSAYDPAGMEKARRMKGPMASVRYCRDPYEVGDGADAIVVVTEWAEFRSLNLPGAATAHAAARVRRWGATCSTPRACAGSASGITAWGDEHALGAGNLAGPAESHA